MEERIVALAVRQQGVVTRRQLIEAGLSPWAVAHRLRSGRLHRLHAGVYRVGPLMPPHAREMAAVLASGPGSVVSHFSAASFRGLWVEQMDAAERSDASPVHITVVHANRGNRPGIRAHRVVRLNRGEWTVETGIPVTTPERTLVDLAGMVGSRELEGMLATAEREGLVGRESSP
ncbi:MAG: type IV toxin-antitoxin system AbiEi family antitoxin domain-containing protein [Gemmatimonadota bacterium]